MKLKYMVAVFLASMTTKALPQKLRVYLNTNDCYNCIASVGILNDLAEAVPVLVYCDETKKRFVPALLDQFHLAPSDRITVHYIPSDSMQAHAPAAAVCEYQGPDNFSWSFNLRDLADHARSIRLTCRGYDRVQLRPIASGPMISDRLKIFPAATQVLISDYLFRQNYAAELESGDSIHLAHFEPDSNLTKKAMMHMVADMQVCDSLTDLYRDWPQFKHHFLAVNENTTGFDLVDAIHYMDQFQDGSPISTSRFVYFNCSKAGMEPILYGKWVEIDPYMIVMNFGYELNDSILTTGVLRRTPDQDSLFLLADWARSGDSIVFSGFRPLFCPEPLLRFSLDHSLLVEGAIREGQYAVVSYPLVYDLSTDKATDIGAFLAPGIKDWFAGGIPQYTLLDLLPISNDRSVILYVLDGVCFVAWIDTKQNKLLRQVKLPTDHLEVTTLRILGDGRLVAFTKDQSALVLLQ